MPPGGEMEEKEYVKWAVSAADGAAEEGLHRNSWNKRRGLEPEHEDVINAFMYIRVATYIYSRLWNIDRELIEKAILKRGERYNRGNLITVKEVAGEIRKLTEEMSGHSIEVTESEETVREVIENLFRAGAREYSKFEAGISKFSSYQPIEEAVHLMVFHLWGGSAIDVYAVVKMTVLDAIKGKIKVKRNCRKYIFTENYLINLEKRLGNKYKSKKGAEQARVKEFLLLGEDG